MATGWLGWRPEDAWRIPIPEIFVAVEARIKWARMCAGEDVRPPAEKIKDQLRKLGK